jgi:hypothetical protein
MADLVTLQGWLADALAAKHKLMIGQLEVTVSYEGKSVSFAQADRDRLDAYIADLQRQIDALTGMPRRRGPVQLAF